MMRFERERFPKQLRYWGLHCVVNALPSFIIACMFLGFWKEVSAVVAMLLAILTFVLIYAALTSLSGPMGDSESLPSRALRLGAKVRLVVSLVSLVVMLCGGFLFLPDFWAGFYSVAAVNEVARLLGHHGGQVVGKVKTGYPLAIYAATMLEGVMISVMLLLVSFFSLLVMRICERRKASSERRKVALGWGR